MTDFATVALSGVVTLLINIISIGIQHMLRNRQETERKKELWYRDVITVSRQIRRKCLELQYGVDLDEETKQPLSDSSVKEDIEVLDQLVSEMISKRDEAPPEIDGTTIDSAMRELYSWYQNPSATGDQLRTTDLKEGTIERVEQIMDEIHHNSDRIESTPY